MFGSRCKQSTITTGTGDLTLAATPPLGFQALANEFFDSTNTSGIPFQYWIANHDWTEIEAGTGQLSATNTFVRDNAPEFTLIGGVAGSGSKISLTAGTKFLFAAPFGRGIQPTQQAVNTTEAADNRLVSTAKVCGGATTASISNAAVHYVPFFYDGRMEVTGVALRNTVAGTGNIVMGIYTVNPATGLPMRLLKQGTVVSNAATGIRVCPITAFGLPPGMYYLAAHKQNSDGTQAALFGSSLNYGINTPLGVDASLNQIVGFTQTRAYDGTLPVTPGTLANVTTGTTFALWLRAA